VTIEELLAGRRLERVAPDSAAARERLEGARRHLRSSELVAEQDPDAAYALLYDAARKAVAAHMLAAGLRARNAPGAHEATARYAALAVDDPASAELDRMRRFRNRIEYGATHFSRDQVAHDLERAQAIVDAVGRSLPPG
jgi:hypothetical protein